MFGEMAKPNPNQINIQQRFSRLSTKEQEEKKQLYSLAALFFALIFLLILSKFIK
jgi:hypothetical protein